MSKTSLSDERKNNSQPFSWSYRGCLSSIWMSSGWWTSLYSSAENPRVASGVILMVLRQWCIIAWYVGLFLWALPFLLKECSCFLNWNESFNLEQNLSKGISLIFSTFKLSALNGIVVIFSDCRFGIMHFSFRESKTLFIKDICTVVY